MRRVPGDQLVDIIQRAPVDIDLLALCHDRLHLPDGQCIPVLEYQLRDKHIRRKNGARRSRLLVRAVAFKQLPVKFLLKVVHALQRALRLQIGHKLTTGPAIIIIDHGA